LKFRKDQWTGNNWAAIGITPEDANFFILMNHLSKTYGFAIPTITDTFEGHFANFGILGSQAKMDMDTWMFSIALEDSAVRDRILADLQAISEDYWGNKSK